MDNKTTRFLNMSLAAVSIFCILIYITQTMFMNLIGEDAIRQLGVLYMSGMSKQVASHFGTTIELRLAQVEALVDAVPPARFERGKTPLEIELTYNARSIGFEYLAFYTQDGRFHMIYGSQITPDVPEALHRSVQGGKYNICAGTDAQGTHIVLMGVPAAYPMGDGQTSIAVVAGLPTSYLKDTLEANLKGDMVIEYSIIRDDGSFILQNDITEEDNYFERVDKLYEASDRTDPKQYARELREALDQDRDYTSGVAFSGERWNVYCTNLPNSEWHLLLKISHGTLERTVKLLQKRWSAVSIGGCSLIIGALLLVFVGYFRLTKRQMYELDEARRSADQARRWAERSNQAKNEFLSNMSHDIRTPMNGIMGMTSVAISNLDNPPRVRSCLKRINVSSRHLLGLINDMLDMSKLESGNLMLNMEPIALREIGQNIVTIIQPQAQEKHQHFNIYIHEVYHENVCSDRVRLTQILLNLLGNAVKFTPEHGTIEVILREEPSPKGEAYIRSRLHIRDNGIGMSKEFIGRAFEAFAREDNARIEKEAGAGMGLAITKYIVDAMGGTIEVESEPGKGSDFAVILDMEKVSWQEQEFHLPGRNVLVVDDDEFAGRLAVEALQSMGLHARAASGADQAIEMAEECRGGGEGFDIVLLDWDVQGQEWAELVRKLRDRIGGQIPVILLTDGEWDELETGAREAGIDGFIAKPLFRSSLYYGLRQFVETREEKDVSEAEAEPDLAGRRILVAEDNELNWEIADDLLSEFGMDLDWAENGQICVDKFEQSPQGWYDAILMDLRMPVKTGFEAASAIRALKRPDAGRIPIIAVSADAFPEDVQKCYDCGMNAHTAKPLDLMGVVDLLQKYFAEWEKA